MGANHALDANNVAVVRGTVSSDPRVRTLPSGTSVTNLEITTRHPGRTASVPVVVHDTDVSVVAGDEVLVIGHVQRRFFRAGGSTQSRTEVVAGRVVPARRTRSIRSALASVVDALSSPDRVE